ncbi:hypothetical protein C10C_0357 [Chlamydia serpentis]|uniref:Cell division protein FtsL n=1 Tax=Chlamydia serpentis TaxID=1967782 RepID=A0A2R8FAS9_9CHLA|nr:hypothetical protein C10C_0357 [Chlamydia serpentis]
MPTETENIRSNKASPFLVSRLSVREKTYGLRFLERTIVNSWWVILSILVSGFIYDRAIQKLHVEELRLQNKVSSLQKEILSAQEEQHQLELHLQHWDDSTIVESALIQRLGLVPKGYIKICITKNKQPENKD